MKMTRNGVIELLEKYNKLLMEEGYADTDLLGESENDSAIDRFFKTDWAKENFPVKPITCDHLWKFGFDECIKCGKNIKDIKIFLTT